MIYVVLEIKHGKRIGDKINQNFATLWSKERQD